MASFSGSMKVSDVLEILSVQTISDDIYRRIPPSSTSGNRPWSYEREKQTFTDAVHYCMVLLRQSNRLTNSKSDVLSMEATLTGHEMFERIRGVEVKFEEEPEVQVSTSTAHPARRTAEPPYFANKYPVAIKQEVIDVTDNFHGDPYVMPLDYSLQREKPSVEKEFHGYVKSEKDRVSADENSPRNSSDFGWNKSAQRSTMAPDSPDENNLPLSPLSLTESDECQPSAITKYPSSVARKSNNTISLAFKKKVVDLVQKHPDWSLKQLQENGCEKLNCMSQIRRWKKHVREGGTQMDKFDEINSRTYEWLVRAQLNSETVTVEKLRKWAVAISRELYGTRFNFNATRGWAYNFKKVYDVRCSSSGILTIPNNQASRKSRKLSKSNRRRTTNN